MSSEREKHSKTAQGLAELLQNVGVSLTDFAMKLTEQGGNVMSALLASGEGFSAEVLGSLLEDLQVPPVLDAEASSYVISSFLDGDGPRLNESDGPKDMADDKELPHINLDEGTWTCVCTVHVPLSEATCNVCEYYYDDVIDTQAFKDANPEDLGDEGDDDEDDESGGKDIAKGGDGVFAEYSDSDRSWAVALPEDKSQADVETVDEPRRAQFLRLKSYFLSEEFGAQLLKEEEASSAKSSEDHKAKKLIKESEARAFAYKLIPDIDRFLDRREEAPALNLVLLTLRNGLPLYEKFPAIQQHTIRSMQFIFDQLMNHLKENIARSYLQRLVDSFRACQAEQARVIDSIYGSLSGRDKTLKQQLLNLIDDHKERVLEQTVLALNPGAISQDDSVPQKQLPHIRSSYRISAGPRLGLGHIQSAKVDYCKFRICAEHRQLVIDAYLRLFLLHDLLDVFVNDVNQQDPEAERLIDIDLLTKWAGNKEENNGFDAYSIYYDETQPKLYNDAKPLEQNAYQPFLSRHVALDILSSLFLSSPLSGSSSAASV